MIRSGVYVGGKVLYRQPVVHALTGGNWETGWTGTKSFGGDVVEYIVENRLDWWPTPNQEVDFNILDTGEARIVKLGKILDSETVTCLYR